jgi:hypothetical protein
MIEFNGICIGQPESVASFGSMLSWGWIDCGVRVCDESTGQELVRVTTQFPSRDGVRIIDAIRQAGEGCMVQACNNHSVQVFSSDGSLVSDLNVN